MVGHTKFAPNHCFGLIKRLYRRTKVSSLLDIAQMINKYGVCNMSQLVDDENGATIVPVMNSSEFFSPHYKKVSGITKYHHIIFESSQPGKVTLKENFDSHSN